MSDKKHMNEETQTQKGIVTYVEDTRGYLITPQVAKYLIGYIVRYSVTSENSEVSGVIVRIPYPKGMMMEFCELLKILSEVKND